MITCSNYSLSVIVVSQSSELKCILLLLIISSRRTNFINRFFFFLVYQQVLVKVVSCYDLLIILFQEVIYPQLVLILKLEQLILMVKELNYRYGILPDKRDFEQSPQRKLFFKFIFMIIFGSN